MNNIKELEELAQKVLDGLDLKSNNQKVLATGYIKNITVEDYSVYTKLMTVTIKVLLEVSGNEDMNNLHMLLKERFKVGIVKVE